MLLLMPEVPKGCNGLMVLFISAIRNFHLSEHGPEQRGSDINRGWTVSKTKISQTHIVHAYVKIPSLISYTQQYCTQYVPMLTWVLAMTPASLSSELLSSLGTGVRRTFLDMHDQHFFTASTMKPWWWECLKDERVKVYDDKTMIKGHTTSVSVEGVPVPIPAQPADFLAKCSMIFVNS